VDGAVTDERRVVHTFDADYGDQWVVLPPVERGRIQMIYVPSFRDGARQVSAFLRSRLWRASQWTDKLRALVTSTADTLAENFHTEPVVTTVESMLTHRWRQLHQAGTDTIPSFQPIDRDLSQIVRNAELLFAPSHTGHLRHARFLSDGQRSLLHLALTATALDIEAKLADGAHSTEFDVTSAHLPTLTVLAVEEPENSLAPFFLSRIVLQILDLCAGPRAQAILSSHSASVLTRIEPDLVRHFRLDPSTDTAVVRPIGLPADETEAGKYIREAVKAHPELYFARFVVLGEGDSEELVIPLIAQARNLAIDRSFVAMVPLGGRHTNHFWRLLNDLRIPHATLLDLDLGRAGGGGGQIRDVCRQLLEVGRNPFEGIDGYKDLTDIKNDLDSTEITKWLRHLRRWNVFFSIPLDLDMALLRKFWGQYTQLEPGERGPSDTDAADAVLGTEGATSQYWNPTNADKLATRKEQLRWYRYRFLTRSKPSTHLRVLSSMTDQQLKEAPGSLVSLIAHIAEEIGQ
ncbi:MAG: ATP-dependent nuclease, partial [Pseudonocardiaceae bacterium]